MIFKRILYGVAFFMLGALACWVFCYYSSSTISKKTEKTVEKGELTVETKGSVLSVFRAGKEVLRFEENLNGLNKCSIYNQFGIVANVSYVRDSDEGVTGVYAVMNNDKIGGKYSYSILNPDYTDGGDEVGFEEVQKLPYK